MTPSYNIRQTDSLITADASKVSGAEFFDAVFGVTPEMREEKARLMREQCIAATERGDTYGWPPLMVAECREIMAGEQLTEAVGDPLLNKRRAA